MARHHHLDLHLLGPGHCRVKVVNLKPEKDTISMGFEIWITDRTVMVLHIPLVQLKDQPPLQDQTFILRTAMRTLTAKQSMIPPAAQFDIAHANQRLCTHRGLLLVTVSICPSAPPASDWSPALSLSLPGTVRADRAGSRESG